jgi:hypothetical protein
MSNHKGVEGDDQHESRLTRSERVLIGVIVLLAICMTYVVLIPGSTVGGSRNEQRLADAKIIAIAVRHYLKDGTNPRLSIGSSDEEICSTQAKSCKGLVDLHYLTLGSRYLRDVPHDPECPRLCTANEIGFTISENDKGQVTVSAPFSEQNKLISATQ